MKNNTLTLCSSYSVHTEFQQKEEPEFSELTYMVLLASCIFNCFHLVKIRLLAYEITHTDSCSKIYIAFHVLTTHFIQHRWRLVIHGGIDGYSRIPVFLHCSDNNEATTVLQLFI